jgi:UDP-N-acetylmuramoylalanine--D-glutamate ligase
MRKAFHEKKITVVGLARSGAGAANLLTCLGADVTVNDRKPRPQLDEVIDKLNKRVSVVTGSHPPELFETADLVIVSPGVPSDIPPLRAARERGVRVIGELELAYEVLRSEKGAACPEFLAITGSNGKSTTTTLLYEMLVRGGIGAVLAGNIGYSVASEVQALVEGGASAGVPQFMVVELSSFQLETTDEFRPRGAAILNITPDHLDRYHEMEAYMDAKCRISLKQLPTDYLVLNADDPLTPDVLGIIGRQRGGGAMPVVLYFSRERRVEGIYLDNGLVRFNLSREVLDRVAKGVTAPDCADSLDPAAFRIKGVHNIENAMAAALMAFLSGCGVEALRDTLRDFPGLEHRLEFVRELDGVKYINDSKGTNVGATMKSLEGFSEPVVLIAGGRDKDSDFTLLRPLVKEKVKKVILVGEAAEKISRAVSDLAACGHAGYDMDKAVRMARQAAAAGDVVLLSPACASFDMFSDFEDRGRRFKMLVEAL